MTNTPSETEIDNLLCKHWPGYSRQAVLVKMWLREAIKSAIAKWAAPQQEATKAAPGELKDHQILAITTAYEQGVGKGHQAYKSGKEIANPYDSAYGCDLAWQYGYGEGKEQAQRATKAAPQQEAQEPLTDAQIAEMMRDTWGCASIAPRHALEFARAVERAHGITQKGGSNADT